MKMRALSAPLLFSICALNRPLHVRQIFIPEQLVVGRLGRLLAGIDPPVELVCPVYPQE
jgi:hypothetical protein